MTVRTHRFVWILVLSLFLASGPGFARALAHELNGGGSRISTTVPHAADPAQRATSIHASAPSSLAFQSDDAEDVFEDYLERTDSLEIAFGPEEGELEHDPDAVTFQPAEVDLENFIVHAEFTNPYAADDNPWDIGFLFRLGGESPHLHLTVTSAGDWVQAPAQSAAIDKGSIDNLNLDAGDTNVIDLVVDGDVGYFGVNGEFVSELDLSSNVQSGDVAIATAFYEGNYQEGEATGFDDFMIWNLESSGASPEPEETVTTEPEETVTAEPEETVTAEPEETVTAEPEETVTTTAGGSYESPTFGYTLTFGDEWGIDFQEVDNGVDSLRLNNGTSTVDFLGYESDLTPAECVADELNYYESSDEYTDVEVARDENDNELQGEFDDPEFGESAFVVVSFTYTPEEADDGKDYIAYIECRTIEPGESLLRIVHYVPFDDYNDQVEPRVDLLEGLRLEGGSDVTPEPEESVTPATGNVYESPTYGYSITFSDDWTIDTNESDNGVDALRLNNGTSTVDFHGYESDLTPAECVADELDFYENADDFADIEIATDENGLEIQGTFDDPEFGEVAYTAVSFTFTDADGNEQPYMVYVECRTLEEGASVLKIAQFVPFDDWNEQAGARQELLEGLLLGGPGPDETPEPEGSVTPETSDVYESPTYGFTLPMNDDWEIERESSDNGVDSVRFANGVSTIDFLAYETEWTPLECVDDEIEYFENADGFANAEVMEDEDGEEMRGDSRDSAFAVVSFGFTNDSGEEIDYVAFVECRALEQDGAQLKIEQFAPADVYEDEFASREELLEGLVIGEPSEVTPEPTAEPDVTPEAGGATVAVVLDSFGTSVVSGLATITDDGSESQVMILVSGADDGALAIIQEGDCGDLPGEAAFELESIEDGFSDSTIDATITDLTDEDYVITLHEEDADLDDPLACGEIAS